MVDWTNLPPAEIERRRTASVDALAVKDREAFARRYQEHCDRTYWTQGQCCAGCDHWQSDAGNSGQCAAAGIMSGADVTRSLGWTFSSYTPPPGFPFTSADFHCGKFSDDFDWSTLDPDYLRRIGAFADGAMKPKPRTATARDKT